MYNIIWKKVIQIGNNILSNRLSILNNKIKLDWLNQSLQTFKINCKKTSMAKLGELLCVINRLVCAKQY